MNTSWSYTRGRSIDEAMSIEDSDVPQEDDQQKIDGDPEPEPIKYHLTATDLPMQNVSYVATVDQED